MWRHFTYTRKQRHVDSLNYLVLSYNKSKHQTIRMSLSDVTIYDELDILRDMHNIPVPREPTQSFLVGDNNNNNNNCLKSNIQCIEIRVQWTVNSM